MPSRLAAASVSRQWLDWMAPVVISVSALCARASATTYVSLRTLLPPSASGSVSSRLISRSGPPSSSDSRSIRCSGDGPVR